MDTLQSKICSLCHFPKLFADFNKKARSKDSHRPECRMCQAEFHQVHKSQAQARNHKRKAEIDAYNARYHQEHCEVINARHARNRIKNLATRLAYDAQYRAEHLDYFREAAKRRRAQQAGAQITDLSLAQFEEILKRSNYRCCYCPDDCKECKRKTHTFEKEHLTPISKGGNHTVQNVLPSCPKCNAKKYVGNVLKPVQPFLLTEARPHVPKRRRRAS